MGKRSNYEHHPNDFYATPRAAVLPLLPHLRGIKTFAEPCAGEGDLVRHLESFGLRCVYQGDIATGQDALALTIADCNDADAIITNTPYDTDHRRKLMHAMIRHFQQIAPTWLLLHLDWASDKQASPYLLHCSDIVVIGRVKWIKGTKGGGMENFAWYRFDARHTGGTTYRNGRGIATCERHRSCASCGKVYAVQRSTSRYCSGACRIRAWRA
jgi:hypothetical protein